MKVLHYDVAVVGGGPSGLWLACELRLGGASVCVIERRVEPVGQSRSLTIHGRTLEIFALRGIAGRFLDRGRPVRAWRYAGLPTPIDFGGVKARYPFMLFIPQSQTERLLEARARELGVAIHRGWTVDGMTQDGDGCRLTGDGPCGRFEVSSVFVVGADGARSLVRQVSGIGFEGLPATQSVMMADARLQLPDDEPTLSLESEQGGLTILPMGDGTYRIIRMDPERAHVDRHHPLSEDELRDSLIRIAGSDFSLDGATWLTRFTDETRLAECYRRGRVFLIGDAAHIHAPMGGQGLNVGLQDAMNLGWKLNLVLQGRAPAALLESYEAERRPIGERLFENTLAQVALVSRFDMAALAGRRAVDGFLRHPTVNREVAGELSGFDIVYPLPLPGLGVVPGQGRRAPDTDLRRSDGSSTSVYEHLQNGKWLHLKLGPAHAAPAPTWLSAGDVVEVAGTPDVTGDPFDCGAMLIRPDGYVASVAAAVRP